MANRYPPEWVDEVRGRSDIIDVVGSYVHLTPRGRKHWGLCPFHGEKTPSFSVDGEKQLYYCFGCHAGGSVFQFIMGMERMDFKEAVQHLAERARMPLPELREDPGYKQRMQERERMVEACREAARFFHDQLFTGEGARAREYYRKRGLSERVITRFGLGYAPDRWDALLNHLGAKGYEPEFLARCSLIQHRQDRYYDAFRGRAMFPILDERGRVVAFGGRVLGEGQPKYLNSSESPVFNKRRLLYGLNYLRGKTPARLLVVEGYMDVVSLYQHGVPFAVASLGTALTPEHAKLIRRTSGRVLLCYDGDAAGQRAAEKGIEVLEAEGVEPRVVSLPGGQDPDDYIRAQGADAFMAELDQALDATTFRLRRQAQTFDMSSQEGRTDYAIAAAKIVAREENPVARENYLRALAVETGFERDILAAQVDTAMMQEGKTPQNTAIKNRHHQMRNTKTRKAGGDERAEQGLLLAMMFDADRQAQLAGLGDEVFQTQENRVLYLAMRDALGRGETLTPAGILSRLEDEEHSARGAELFAQELPPGDRGRFVKDCLMRLEQRTSRIRVDTLKERLAQPGLSHEERKEIVMEMQKALMGMKGIESTEGGEGGC